MRYLFATSLLLAGCPSPPEDLTDPAETGDGVFAAGCPGGNAVARVIDVDASLPGEVAVGTRGDVLLANDHAAFVITAPEWASPDTSDVTYWHYGGAIADAAPMLEPCVPGEDKLDEVGFLAGRLRLDDVAQSVLRGYRADTLEVVADGSDGGTAVVRATGVDDIHWLLEYELIQMGIGDGGRPFSDPLEIEWVVEYRLEPDSGLLAIDHRITNLSPEVQSFVLPALLSFAPRLDLHRFASSQIDLGPLSLRTGIPYLATTDGEVGYAWSPQRGNLAYVGISGIDVTVDIEHATTDPITVMPGEEAFRRTFFAVTNGGSNAASRLIAEADPELVPGETAAVESISGTVVDAGGPVAGVPVVIEADSGSGFDSLDQTWTDSSGRFSAWIPGFEDAWDVRVVARPGGRDDSEAVTVSDGANVELEIGLPGTLNVDVTAAGSPTPARLELVRSDGETRTFFTAGASEHPIPPGDWTYTVTRGWEYTLSTGSVTVPEDGQGTLSADLERVVDSSGWITVDTHTHSSQSPDSDLPPEEQLLQAAAHGLEVVVHSEHENIADLWGLSEAIGLGTEVTGIVGQEVTAPIPEHMTAFPIDPDGTLRGGPIPWYSLDVGEMYAAIHERTNGGIRILNHPGYMDTIGWDYVAGEATLEAPWELGLGEDVSLWSWDFEGIELMNGTGNPFSRGRFDKWMSLANAGYPKVGAGSSDDHGRKKIGWARSYVQVPDDTPDGVAVADIVSAYQDGAVSLAAGAFVEASVDGAGPGELVAGSGTVDLDIRVQSIPEIDISHVIVFANCDQVDSIATTDPSGVVKLDTTVPVAIDGDTHLVVAAFGSGTMPDGMPGLSSSTPRGMTGTILVDANSNGAFDAPGGRICDYDLAAP